MTGKRRGKAKKYKEESSDEYQEEFQETEEIVFKKTLAYSVKETTIEPDYKLKGKPNGINNFDEFSWWFPKHFSELDGLWDTEHNVPTWQLTTMMLLRNMDISLHSDYRNYETGEALWKAIIVQYKANRTNSQAILLSNVAKYQPPVDMDEALRQMQKNVRLMVSAFGSLMQTEEVVQILFTQNLPSDYETARLMAIASPVFDFASLENSLKAIWDDKKRKKGGKAFLASTKEGKDNQGNDEVEKLKLQLKTTQEQLNKAMIAKPAEKTGERKTMKCSVHTFWDMKGDVCSKCSPCQVCVERGAYQTSHVQDTRRCPFYNHSEKGTALMAKGVAGPIDSGASNHTFSNKEVFDFYSTSSTQIEIANGSMIDVPGRGDVSVKTSVGNAHFSDAFHCPTLCESALFSVSKFDSKGFTSIFANSKYYLVPRQTLNDLMSRIQAEAVFQGSKRKDGLYWLEVEIEKSVPKQEGGKALMASSSSRSARQWHLALNHPSNDRLKQMTTGLVTGCTISGSLLAKCDCSACFMGKSKQSSYPNRSLRAIEAAGDVISVDGFGPVKDADWNGNRYYLAFVDHFTGKSFLFLYRSPAEVAQIVVDFMREAQTYLGRPIKVLRSDKEGGYVSTKVSEYCRSVGTRQEFTLTDAHEQNGVSESFNLHCLDAVRTMLVQSGLGEDLWGEACMHYNYTRNKLPTTGRSLSPDELWYKKKPDVSHLRPFGEPCFAHLMPKDQITKIFPRATRALLVGYDLNTKAYRLLDPDSHSLFLSRSVQFLPDYAWPEPKGMSRFGDMERDAENVVTIEKRLEPISSSNRFDPLSGDDSPGEEMDNVSLPKVPFVDPFEVKIIGDPMAPVQTRSFRHRMLMSRSPVSLVLEPPQQFNDISGRHDAEEWYTAAANERRGIKQMGVGEVVRRPKNKKVIKNRYVFTRKASGLAKGRVVLQDYVKKGESSTYSPVAEDSSFKVLCTIAATEDLDMFQYDVIQAFLHANMDEDVYTELPSGWELESNFETGGDYVLLLKKALYGHRKAPYLWNQEIDSTLKKLCFEPSPADPCLYVKFDGKTKMLLLLHVDDFIIADNDTAERSRIVSILKERYGIKELGEVSRYTNYQVVRDREKREVYIHQYDFIAELLQLANMSDCTASKTKSAIFADGVWAAKSDAEVLHDLDGLSYRQLTGSLIHLSCHSRPDIAFEVATLCKYTSRPTMQHWKGLKQLLRYLKYTAHDVLVLGGKEKLALYGYADSGFASDWDTGKSPGGYVFFLGSSVVAHKSKWFSNVYPSSTETELASLYMGVSMAEWLRKLLDFLGYNQDKAIAIAEDNQGAIKYTLSKECSGRMKHIDVKFHWIRERIVSKSICVEYVASADNVADIFTKTLKGTALARHRASLRLFPLEHLRVREE